jgi:hypothetical protein
MLMSMLRSPPSQWQRNRRSAQLRHRQNFGEEDTSQLLLHRHRNFTPPAPAPQQQHTFTLTHISHIYTPFGNGGGAHLSSQRAAHRTSGECCRSSSYGEVYAYNRSSSPLRCSCSPAFFISRCILSLVLLF